MLPLGLMNLSATVVNITRIVIWSFGLLGVELAFLRLLTMLAKHTLTHISSS